MLEARCELSQLDAWRAAVAAWEAALRHAGFCRAHPGDGADETGERAESGVRGVQEGA